MASQREIAHDMTTALAVTEPELDTGVGSVVRKLIDAVAEVVAERDAQAHTRTYAYDIDTRSGADLDEMVGLFGFSRLPAIRASGELTFTRSAQSAQNALIPAGTQVASVDGVVLVTAVSALIGVGETSISVPAMALEGGLDGNISAGTATIMRSAVAGVGGVTNQLSFTGGADEEGDAALRARFRATVFRNLSGTEAMFLGIALDDPEVTHASVLGATQAHYEKVEVVSGEATSTNIDASYIMPESVVFGTSIQEGQILREDVDFSVSVVGGDNQKQVHIEMLGNAPLTGIFDLEFSYTSSESRNDPERGITNRVDIWAHGTRVVEATGSLVFRSAFAFNTVAGDRFHRENFRRLDYSHPESGNFFIPYPLSPVVDPSTSDSLTIDGVVYQEGVHYWLVQDVTPQGGAPRSWSGVELRSSANGSPLADPSNNSTFSAEYAFNEVPRAIESAVENWRLVTSDVWVHQAREHRLRLNFAVQLLPGYTLSQAQASIEENTVRWLNSLGFTGLIQASDLLYIAKGSVGVDAARFLTDSDNAVNYGIQQMSGANSKIKDWTTGSTPRRAVDVHLAASEVAVLHDVNLVVMATNTWGSV